MSVKGLDQNQPYDPRMHAGGGGYYQMAFKSGLITGIAANSPLFSFRWAPAAKSDGSGRTYRCQLKFIKVDAVTMTAFGAAQLCDFYTYCAKTWSASDTGGTQVLPAAGDQKRQKQYADSLFVGGGDIRIATTGALSAGTRTLEAQPFSSFKFWSGAIGSSMSPPVLEEWDEHHVPMVFEPNQGVIIQNGTAFGATGVVQLWVDLMWMEEPEPGAW